MIVTRDHFHGRYTWPCLRSQEAVEKVHREMTLVQGLRVLKVLLQLTTFAERREVIRSRFDIRMVSPRLRYAHARGARSSAAGSVCVCA